MVVTETMPADPADTAESSTSISGLRYGEALAELEELLDELEDVDIDVDHLADRVARGVELVRFCRDRLAVVTADVDQVVADLLVGDADRSDDPDGAGGGVAGNGDRSGDGSSE